MLVHIPRAIARFEAHHKWHLIFFFGRWPYEAMLALMYFLLPTVIAMGADTTVAGIAKSVALFSSAFIFTPIAGSLADRYGARFIMRIASWMTIATGAMWLFLPQTTWTLAGVLVLFYLRGAFNNTEIYLLRTTAKKDGGLIFGLDGNFWSLGSFVATLALPLFVAVGHETWAAWTMLVTGISYAVLTFFLPDDRAVCPLTGTCRSLFSSLNPFESLAYGWHFIRTNQFYPLLPLSYAVHSAIFKGVVWFVLPIHLASLGLHNASDSLPLGVYDLVTMLLAGATGYLADHAGWQRVHVAGWGLLTIAMALLPISTAAMWLVGVGAVISLAQNLAYSAATSALELHDHDHVEDGAFVATKGVVSNFVEAFVPLIAGVTYATLGFRATLGGMAVIIVAISLAQLAFVFFHRRHVAATMAARAAKMTA